MALNNNQAFTIVNELWNQYTGQKDVATVDLQTAIDNGSATNILTEKEQFTKALVARLTKNWFEDSSYRSQYKDVFFEDSSQFGAIMQSISVEVPEVKESHAWKDFTPVAGEPATAGVYKLYLPVVDSKYYGKSISWELPICITNEQYDMAFTSNSELTSFVNYILMCVDNAIITHLEAMNEANRNSFIANKFVAQESAEVEGIHVVNLVEEYQKSQSTPANMTAKAFLNNSDALRFSSERLKNDMLFLQKMTTLYNTAGKKRFIPKDRLVFQLLGAFKNRYDRVALTDAFNKEFDELPLHELVPYWQGTGKKTDWDDISKIDVKVADNKTVSKSGIVAFLCDKWAIMHTIKKHRVAATYFDPEALTQYYNQFRDQYMNNLTMNAVVYVVQDYTVQASTGQNEGA